MIFVENLQNSGFSRRFFLVSIENQARCTFSLGFQRKKGVFFQQIYRFSIDFFVALFSLFFFVRDDVFFPFFDGFLIDFESGFDQFLVESLRSLLIDFLTSFWSIFEAILRRVLDQVLARFWSYFWRGFGPVSGRLLGRFLAGFWPTFSIDFWGSRKMSKIKGGDTWEGNLLINLIDFQ